MKSFIGSRLCRAVSVLAIGLLGGLTWMPGQAFSQWSIGKPIVTYWYHGLPLIPSNAQQYVDGGWNLVSTNVLERLDVAQAYGLRVMWTGALDDATVISIRDHPALYAYFVADEPSVEEFAAVGATVARLRALDPNNLGYVNIGGTGTTQQHASNYPAHVTQYMDAVQPSLLSYDHYPFWSDGRDIPWYYASLAYISYTSRRTGVPFMNIAQTSSWDPNARVPTGDELRYQWYTTLAYGAQGISNFVYYKPDPNFTGGMVLADGTPTPLYTTAQTINPEFAAIAEQLQPLEHIGAYHLGDLPWGTGASDDSSPMRLPGNSPFALSPDIPDSTYVEFEPIKGAVLGLFGPDSQLADATHTVVVNLDYSNGLNTTVTGPENLSVFDPATGAWIAQGNPWADVSLLPGGGVLVGLTSAVPTALGDFNNDGAINSLDSDIMKANWLSTGIAFNTLGEVTNDGIVNVDDFSLFKETLFGVLPGSASASAVPEPNSLSLLAMAGLGLLACTWRKRR